MFPKLSKGTHVGHPMVHTLRGRSVRIESPGVTAYADGESSARSRSTSGSPRAH